VDIKEDENNIIVEADLPGLEKKDINVHVENNTLSISGAREVKKEEKEKGWHRSERQYGKFERSFYLGENVDSQKIKAEFDKGVLKISVPKKEEAKPKAIDIEVK
jgi:HSP20 family protein